jgi:O-antigen ligase
MSVTALVFLAAFGCALLLALVRSPVWGLYAYVATFYLHPVDRWWGAGLPELRWSLIAALVTILAAARMPKDPLRPPWPRSTGARFVILMTAWLWIQSLWALSPADHFELCLLYSKYIALFYLMYRLLDSPTAIRNFMAAHVLGCLYLGLLVLEQPEGGRLESVGGPGIDEANALGMHLATGAFSAAALLGLRGTSLWLKSLGVLSLPLILNGLIQTGSRGAFLSVAAAGLVFLYLNPAELRGRWVALALVGLVALLPMVPAKYWDRIGTIAVAAEDTGQADTSAQTRVALLAAQWQMFLSYPLGSGHRGTAYLSPRYLAEEQLSRSAGDPAGRRARSSHNTAMTALAEHGIPGITLFGIVVLWAARTLRRPGGAGGQPPDPARQVLLATTGATLTVVLVAGLFTDYIKAEAFIWGLAWLSVLDGLPSTTGSQSPSEYPAPKPASAGLRDKVA